MRVLQHAQYVVIRFLDKSARQAYKTAPSARTTELVDHRPRQQWNHDLMVARDLVASPTVQCRPLDDVHARPIVTLHVEVARDEALWPPLVEIAGDGQRL
jgi:hypothetical protein